MQRLFDRYRSLLLLFLSVFIISGSSVRAQQHQRAPRRIPDRAGRPGQTTAAGIKISGNINGEQGKATTNSPFDVAAEQRPGSGRQPFDAHARPRRRDAVVSPFGHREKRQGGERQRPVRSPSETPANQRR